MQHGRQMIGKRDGSGREGARGRLWRGESAAHQLQERRQLLPPPLLRRAPVGTEGRRAGEGGGEWGPAARLLLCHGPDVCLCTFRVPRGRRHGLSKHTHTPHDRPDNRSGPRTTEQGPDND